MLHTGWVVVRRTVSSSAPGRSIAMVVSDTCTVRVRCLCSTAQGDLLSGDHDHPGVRGAALHGDRLGGRSWHRPDRTAPLQPGGFAGLERVGSGAQQLTGGDVEEQQWAAFLDVDPDSTSGEDLGGEQGVSDRLCKCVT